MVAICAMLVALVATPACAEIPIPKLQSRVTDLTNTLNPEQRLRKLLQVAVGRMWVRAAVEQDLAEEVFETADEEDAQPPATAFSTRGSRPGYLGWVVDDGPHAHVGLAGYTPTVSRTG